MAERTLDSAYRQVLVHYEGDSNGFVWHHRLLVVPGREGRWVGVTPTHSVQVIALLEMKVRPLRRAAAFPSNISPSTIFAFDAFQGREEDDLVAECLDLAAVMGIGPPPAAPVMDGAWYFGDPSYEGFGQKVPEEALVEDESAIFRGSAGLAQVDGLWTFIERVPARSLEAWKTRKRTGPGRDPRIACEVRDSRGTRLASEAEVMQHWRAPEKTEPSSALPGPAVVPEFF